jgi:hypothetical protein
MHTTIRSRIEKCRLLPRFPSPSDAVPVAVLLDTSTLLRCSIPPMPLEPAHDAVRSPINATFADYVATLPLWERDLLAHATEEHCPDSSLCELLQQTNVNILVASDGGHKDDYGSFGWVIGTKDEVILGCEGVPKDTDACPFYCS